MLLMMFHALEMVTTYMSFALFAVALVLLYRYRPGIPALVTLVMLICQVNAILIGHFTDLFLPLVQLFSWGGMVGLVVFAYRLGHPNAWSDKWASVWPAARLALAMLLALCVATLVGIDLFLLTVGPGTYLSPFIGFGAGVLVLLPLFLVFVNLLKRHDTTPSPAVVQAPPGGGN